MIPQTWPSKDEEGVDETVYAISLLPDVTGLQRWIDYIPVQFNTTPANLNSYGTNDALLVSEETGTAWADYIPVFEEGTVAWSSNNNGYIPISQIINFDFAGVKSLDPRITFTRASTATYFDENGDMQLAADNVARFDHNPLTGESLGLLIEEQRSNLLLNSLFDGTALTTQNVTVTAVPHTLSFYGTGTITLSGASTDGPLVGTGEYPNRVSLTFTPTAGTLTLTVTGDVTRANLEIGSFATSFIPTAGSQATRAADSAVMTGTNFSSWFNPTEGTFLAEADTADVSNPRVSVYISDGTTANRIHTNANQFAGFISTAGVTQLNIPIVSVVRQNNVMSKTAIAFATNNGNVAVNGTIGPLDTSLTVPTVDQIRLGGISIINSPLNGHLKRIAYYPRRLSDAELVAITS